MDFVFPTHIWWGLALPLFAGLLALMYHRSRSVVGTWFVSSEYRYHWPIFKVIFRGLGVVLVFLALLGPYFSKRETQIELAGREVMLILDVSASMLTEDLKPNRLQKAKRELDRLIDNLPGDKIGLIVYAGQGYLQCPMTRDHQAVKMFLELASPGQFEQTGTRLRPALSLAYAHMFQDSIRTEQSGNRAIVILSDGEDYGETYTSLAERFNQAEVPIFLAGVGTYQGGRVPHLVNNRPRGFKTLADGSLVISKLQDEGMKKLAELSGTEYLSLDASYKTMDGLIEQLELLSASPVEEIQQQIAQNLYQPILLAGILFLFISMFILPVTLAHDK
ncbi:MAG: VWA domain-containing protein [Bacteroidota bacterium]